MAIEMFRTHELLFAVVAVIALFCRHGDDCAGHELRRGHSRRPQRWLVESITAARRQRQKLRKTATMMSMFAIAAEVSR